MVPLVVEVDILEADNMYAITKGAATMYCQMMARKFGFPVVIIRPFAVYGYFEEKERLIPAIIISCLAKSKLELSNPNSVRDFIFIDDLIDGYLSAIKNIEKIIFKKLEKVKNKYPLVFITLLASSIIFS